MLVSDEKAEDMIEDQLDEYAKQGKTTVDLLDIVFDLQIPYSQAKRILIKLLGPPNEENA